MIINLDNIKKYATGIYKINYSNNKIYIGQAINIRERAIEHNNKNKYPCDIALKKYDAEIEILEEINDIKFLDNREEFWIKYYNATDKNIGYNILKGGNASGKRGVENLNASLNAKQLDEIIFLLQNETKLSLIDIATKYNVSQSTIFKISQGQSYYNPNLKYPLRSNNHESQQKNEILDYFKSEEQLINLKEDLLYRWDLEIEKDLSKIYNIPIKILRDINNGKKFSEYGNFKYPIRGKNIRNNNNLTLNNVMDILNLLKNTNLSMTKIGEQYKLNRDTISKINLGKAYIIKNYNYPAR